MCIWQQYVNVLHSMLLAINNVAFQHWFNFLNSFVDSLLNFNVMLPGMQSPYFCGTLAPTLGLKTLGLRTLTLTPALKIWTPTPTLGQKSDSNSDSRTYCVIY